MYAGEVREIACHRTRSRRMMRASSIDTLTHGIDIMALYIWWWIAAAILVGVEMVTGTFYLLVVALACIAGGAVAYGG
ncbi:MAG: hypothetical protein N2378_06505, partial [Chloroflexaceae bacterium]|nr:hypothetical protein [Chloroflexaceae bacterium]